MSEPLTVVIAEDEPLVRVRLQALLAEHGAVEVVAECADGVEAVAAVRAHRPDLLLLDIEMPGLNGLDVLEALGSEAPPVVFVTAYDRYSIKAFDLHAVDYVLKPIDEDRLGAALRRSRERVRQGELHRLSRRLLTLLRDHGVEPDLGGSVEPPGVEARGVPYEAGWLSFPVREGWRRVRVAEIDWVEGAGVYVQVHVGDEKSLIRASLNAMEERLPAPPFVRVHRSAIVNVDRVRGVRSLSHGDYLLTLQDDTPIRTSRSYRHNVTALIRGLPRSPSPDE